MSAGSYDGGASESSYDGSTSGSTAVESRISSCRLSRVPASVRLSDDRDREGVWETPKNVSIGSTASSEERLERGAWVRAGDGDVMVLLEVWMETCASRSRSGVAARSKSPKTVGRHGEEVEAVMEDIATSRR